MKLSPTNNSEEIKPKEDTINEIQESGVIVDESAPPFLPPPPPPLPGIGLNTAKLATQIPHHLEGLKVPSVKMKLFNWNKFNSFQVQGTLWSEPTIQTYKDLPFEQIEELFALKSPENSEKGKHSATKSKSIAIIDNKRAQNLGFKMN